VFDKKWIQIIGMALSFPSIILIMALGTMELIKSGVVSRGVGWSIYILVIFNFIFLMVRFAFIKKKKGKEDNNDNESS
jgi:hypothetical protein